MGITDQSTRFTLRIPDELHTALINRAKNNNRSLNSEMVNIMENAITLNVGTQTKQASDNNHELVEAFQSLNKKQQVASIAMMTALSDLGFSID